VSGDDRPAGRDQDGPLLLLQGEEHNVQQDLEGGPEAFLQLPLRAAVPRGERAAGLRDHREVLEVQRTVPLRDRPGAVGPGPTEVRGEPTVMTDQRTVSCLGCGAPIPYDRWSGRLQFRFCSDFCRRSWEERYGRSDPLDVFTERAKDPNICIMCRSPLQKTRGSRLYCSVRCQKQGRRLGINADSLGKIRLEAIASLDRVSAGLRGHRASGR